MSDLDLTLGDVELLGGSSARAIRALLVDRLAVVHGREKAEQQANTMTSSDILAAVKNDDDLPRTYRDGMPVSGGRFGDPYVVAFAMRFNWPPDVTRRQSLRDLRMLAEALEGAK